MSNKMVTCKTCGAEIAKAAKTCPHCGAKSKKIGCLPVILILLAVFILIGSLGSSDSEANVPPEEIEYQVYTVDELVDELKSNAMSAEEKYKGQYVEIKGRLNVIDSDGKYIALYPVKDEWALDGVQCYIKNDEQKQLVMNMSRDDIVTLRGKITDVGEVFGYWLDITEIVG